MTRRFAAAVAMVLALVAFAASPASAGTYYSDTGTLYGGCKARTSWVTGVGNPQSNQGARGSTTAVTAGCKRLSTQLYYKTVGNLGAIVYGTTPIVASVLNPTPGQGSFVQLWYSTRTLVEIRSWVALTNGHVLYKRCQAVARTCTERYTA